MYILVIFSNKFQSCFCCIERWTNALRCSEILKFLAWVVFKLLLKNYGGLRKPSVEKSMPSKRLRNIRLKLTYGFKISSGLQSLKYQLFQILWNNIFCLLFVVGFLINLNNLEGLHRRVIDTTHNRVQFWELLMKSNNLTDPALYSSVILNDY